MSACTLIASDFPLTEVLPVGASPLERNLAHDAMYDGGADGNCFLHFFQDVQNYTGK